MYKYNRFLQIIPSGIDSAVRQVHLTEQVSDEMLKTYSPQLHAPTQPAAKIATSYYWKDLQLHTSTPAHMQTGAISSTIYKAIYNRISTQCYCLIKMLIHIKHTLMDYFSAIILNYPVIQWRWIYMVI